MRRRLRPVFVSSLFRCALLCTFFLGCGDDDDGNGGGGNGSPTDYNGWWECHDYATGEAGELSVGMAGLDHDITADTLSVWNGGAWLRNSSFAVSDGAFSGWAWGNADNGLFLTGAPPVPAGPLPPLVETTQMTWWHGIEIPETRAQCRLVRATMPLDGTFQGTGSVMGYLVPADSSPAFALLVPWYSGSELHILAPAQDGSQFCLMIGSGHKLDAGTFAVPGELAVNVVKVMDASYSTYGSADGSLVFTEFSADRIVGTFDLTVGMEAISGTFDLPTNAWGKTPAPDAYEPDDTYGSATPISGDQAHSIDFVNDADWVSFVGVAGTDYYVRTTITADLSAFRQWPIDFGGTPVWVDQPGMFVRAFAPDGTTALTSWTSHRTSFTCPADGTYYVRVVGNPGAYSISITAGSGVSEDAYEPDDTVGDADPCTIDGSPRQHTLHSHADLDWISFDAVQDSVYYVRALQADETCPALALYDTDGITIMKTGLDEIVFRCTATGTYYVVASYAAGVSEVGAYELEVSTATGVAPDVYEPDNVPGEATAAALDTLQSHTLHAGDDEDWVSFQGQSGTWYYFLAEDADGHNAATNVYDTDGTTWLASGFGPFGCPADGTYFVRVSSSSYLEYGAYELQVLSHHPAYIEDDYEPDEGLATATPLAEGGPIQRHTLHTSADWDWYSFSVPAPGTTMVISTFPDTALLGFPTYVLLDTDGATQLTTGFGRSITYTYPSAGTYYVAVGWHLGWYYIDIAEQ